MMKRKSEKKEYEKHNSHMVCQTLMLLYCIYNYLTWILSYSKSQHKSSITPLSK